MFTVVFFRTKSGNEPVRDWLKALGADARRRIGEDLLTVQYGWPLGMPLCRPLGEGLYEVRVDLAERRQIARLLFFQSGRDLVVVEGFIKKSQKTPAVELKTARRRKGEYEDVAKRPDQK